MVPGDSLTSTVDCWRENGNHVRSERIDFDVGGPFAQFERAHDSFGDDAESHAGNPWHIPEILVISFENHIVVLLRADEAERPVPIGRSPKSPRTPQARFRPSPRNDPQESGIRLAQMKDHGGRVRSFNGLNHGKGSPLGRVTVPSRIESNVYFTSAEVSARPS